MDSDNHKTITITLIATILIIVIGIVLVFSTKYFEMDHVVAEVLLAVGVTLISAGTIGIIVEMSLTWFVTKKMLELESNFLDRAIPEIIKTVYRWVEKEGKIIPIDKNSVYELIRIGYSQWFMKEDFEKIGISSKHVTKLYQDVQLEEFKEPMILNFSCIIKKLEKIPKEIAGRDNLMNISMHTTFVAVNTAKKDSSEIRFVNKNGLVALFSFDVFEKLPITQEEKTVYVQKINKRLEIQDNETNKKLDVVIVEMDIKMISRIDEKTNQQIIEILATKLGRPIKSNEAFALYQFQGYDENISHKLIYGVFYPYALKPQERITVGYENILPFAENDYLNTSMKSLTRGATFQLLGFEGYDTTISKRLLNNESDTTTHTSTLLSTSSLMLPRSLVSVSWQKKHTN